MRKFLQIATFILLFGSVANAQALLIILFGDQLSTETFQMGINAAGSASTIGGLDNADYRISWAFGAFGEVRLSNDLFLHFNLTIKTPAGAKNVDPFDDFLPIVDSLTTDITITRALNYITLPVFIKYKLGPVKLGLGAQIGYLSSASDVYEGYTYLGDDISLDRDIREKLNHWDGGVTGIIDYFFAPEKNMRSLRVSLTYYYGLTDMLKDNTGDAWNNSVFLLSLAIPVGGSDDAE